MKKISLLLLILFTVTCFAQGQGLKPINGLKIGSEGLYIRSLNIGGVGIDQSDGVVPPAITIPTDSLKLYIEFYKDRGLGLSTYQQKMPSLYVDGTRNGDTLQLGATSNAESDDPTDSTAFGYLYFDDINDFLISTQNYFTSSTFTWVIKFRGFGNGIIIYIASSVYVYTTTGVSFKTAGITGGGDLEYYTNWGLNRGDTISAFTSETKLYANGIERVSVARTITGTLSTTISFGAIPPSTLPVKMRLYSVALYNKILSDAELLMWND